MRVKRGWKADTGTTVSEMNIGGIMEKSEGWGKKRSGERCRKKTARNSTDNMVLLDGCPPSICSVHCFVNSIKLQASWGGTLLSLPIYLNLTLQPSPSNLAENLAVRATNALLSPSSTAHTLPLYVRGSLVKQIKKHNDRPSTLHIAVVS